MCRDTTRSRPRSSRGLLLSLAAAVTCASWTSHAAAQSEAELRRDNQRLQTQVRDLQVELDNARTIERQLRAEVAKLRGELDAARRSGGTVGSTPIPDLPPAEVTIDESTPHASPRALLKAMQVSYEEATKDVDQADDRATFRVLDQWLQRVNREFKGRITWHVKVKESRPGPKGGLDMKVEAVDPVTGTVLGIPFPVRLERQTAHRLRQATARARATDVLVLNGALEPAVRLNSDRRSAGAFDFPPLIGPFAEFGFAVHARSLVPPAPEKDEDKPERNERGKDRDGRVGR